MTTAKRGGRKVAGVMTVSLGVAAISLHSIGNVAMARDVTDFDLSRKSPSIDGVIEFSRTHPESPLVLELVEALPSAWQPEACLRIADIVSPEYFAQCLAALAPGAGPTSPTPSEGRGPLNY
jgi:hypothetical protein